jgi:glycosyltransferase involved in cell wall biosynthesis
MAGIIQDEDYFKKHVEPFIDDRQVIYVGSVGPEKRNDLLGKAAALLASHKLQRAVRPFRY